MEATYSREVLERLAPHFLIKEQVEGRHCTGRSLRIDALLRPRDCEPWKDDSPTFGIEFKRGPLDGGDRGTLHYTTWLAQALDYTHTTWGRHGRLMVLCCPSPFPEIERIYGEPTARFLAHLLGQAGIGVLTEWRHRGLAIVAQGHHVLWDETKGVVLGSRWSVAARCGSR